MSEWKQCAKTRLMIWWFPFWSVCLKVCCFHEKCLGIKNKLIICENCNSQLCGLGFVCIRPVVHEHEIQYVSCESCSHPVMSSRSRKSVIWFRCTITQFSMQQQRRVSSTHACVCKWVWLLVSVLLSLCCLFVRSVSHRSQSSFVISCISVVVVFSSSPWDS